MDTGVEQIEDKRELEQVRRQARRVLQKSVLAGLVLTLIVLVLPR